MPPAPLWITIGPPSSGKTTFLRQRDVTDIAIDDQEGVYVKIPMANVVGEAWREARTPVFYGQSVAQRLSERPEDRAVLQRLSGVISANKCRERLQECIQSSDSAVQLETLCSVVEEHVIRMEKNGSALSSTYDLFLLEAVFSGENMSGIQRAQQAMWNVPIHQAVAWGNTNLRTTDYVDALSCAHQQGRPVHFVVLGLSHPVLPPESSDVSYKELLRRNVDRLCATGRYIPASVVWNMKERGQALLQEAGRGCRNRQDLDRSLARMAGFDLRANGTVAPLKRPHRTNSGKGQNRYRNDKGGRTSHSWDRSSQKRPASNSSDQKRRKPSSNESSQR